LKIIEDHAARFDKPQPEPKVLLFPRNARPFPRVEKTKESPSKKEEPLICSSKEHPGRRTYIIGGPAKTDTDVIVHSGKLPE
jgi:hypothetical protein